MNDSFDFSGWATRNDLRCSDGRTIRRGAFKDDDGKVVPLVWNHNHNESDNVLGHALLKDRPEGTYTYCSFNDTPSGRNAKLLVEHGDIVALSIYANKLKQNEGDVLHGEIKEVSLVLAGANPGAFIDNVIKHGEECDDEAFIYLDEDACLLHACDAEDKKKLIDVKPVEETKEDKEDTQDKTEGPTLDGEELDDDKKNEKLIHLKEGNKMAENKEKTVQDVIDSMNEEQKNVLYALVGAAMEENTNNKNNEDESEDEEEMKHNAFMGQANDELYHADVDAIFSDAKRIGSLKESYLAHTDDGDIPVAGEDYGIEYIDYLYPAHKNVNDEPDFIKRDNDWVTNVMRGVHHSPFSRIRSVHANITADEARAKGYTKGNKKLEEVITLLKRKTSPTTIYKKQKLDRDDILDIKDFNVVSWLKKEMRIMLDEEIARAILIGDGRSQAAEDHIDETCIRPIWTDDSIYTVNNTDTYTASMTDEERAAALIKRIKKSRKNYKGSGNPTLYTTEDVLCNMLLIEDKMGHPLYKTMSELCTALRVKDIVTVPVMENQTRDVSGTTRTLEAILVNLTDYNVGADKGGEVNMFDDFDIDYNQEKYLMETRCSGALIKPYSAIAYECVTEEADDEDNEDNA